MINELRMKEWSLHFDDKYIEENGYQGVLLKSSRTKIELHARVVKK